MIDEKGRLFGKINIIDLIVLLVIIAAVAIVGLSFAKGDSTESQDTLVMKYYIEEANDFVAEKVQVGDMLYDDNEEIELGKVTDVEIGEPVSWAGTADGQYVQVSRDGFSSMIITGEVAGTKTDIGAEINGVKYGVGHTMVLRAGDAKLYLRVYDIAVKE